ncbi:glycosyl transferase [Priestia megaterium]|uniref:ATP-grasp fold amidoligase family protein n=1 Tax=Priestia megaterium TaxID=1404 RepID=UPI0020769759|nr:ATP-grasp fold amidoligase family protein [Priestia megaterium]USD17470.1 glycosyl transferase [Priestia megaterium]USD18561.1 glycosyl transferase [Priestia megaterium]
MRVINTVQRYVRKPRKLIRTLGSKGYFNWMDDKTYLKLVYWGETKQKLNLNNPITFNEKVQWLKLYDRDIQYSKYADKYEVRNFVKDKIGEDYLIPLIGIYNSVDEIKWDYLPEKFVIKCTHGSGSNIICNNKSNLDINESTEKINTWMKKNWYWFGREWSYKNIKPRIICEKYMVDESGVELKDYKIFCFDGKPQLIQVDFNRFVHHKRNIYTTEWNFVDASIRYPNDASVKIERPSNLEKMLELASKLSESIPQVRIDFYSIKDNIYFGEMTFYHGSGFEEFEPKSLGVQMGQWIELNRVK